MCANMPPHGVKQRNKFHLANARFAFQTNSLACTRRVRSACIEAGLLIVALLEHLLR